LLLTDEEQRIAANMLSWQVNRISKQMTAPLPGRPIRSNAPQTLEKFHIYILLVFGIALVGASLTVIDFATLSYSAVGLGAGALATAGLIAVFFRREVSSDDRGKERAD
jgi:hypothetical protein